MPRFNVNAPDGSVIPVDAPEGATEQDAIAFAASTYKPNPSEFGSTAGGAAIMPPRQPARPLRGPTGTELITDIAGAGVLGSLTGLAAPELIQAAGVGLKAFPGTAALGGGVEFLGRTARAAGAPARIVSGGLSGVGSETAGKLAEGMGATPGGLVAEAARFVGGGLSPEFLRVAGTFGANVLSSYAMPGRIDAVAMRKIAGQIAQKISQTTGQPLTEYEQAYVAKLVADVQGSRAPNEALGAIGGQMQAGAQDVLQTGERRAADIVSSAKTKSALDLQRETQLANQRLTATNTRAGALYTEANAALNEAETAARAELAAAEKSGEPLGATIEYLATVKNQATNAAKQTLLEIGRKRPRGNTEIGDELRTAAVKRERDFRAAASRRFEDAKESVNASVAKLENSGLTIDRNPEYKKLVAELQAELVPGKNNPDVAAGYRKILDQITGKETKPLGVLAQAQQELAGGVAAAPTPVSYNAIDQTRRLLGESFGGLPVEGYANIDLRARQEIYKRIRDLQVKFAGPKADQMLKDYADSRPELAVFGSKAGQQLTGMDRSALTQFATDPSKMPGYFFKTPTAFQNLVDLVGDKALATQAGLDHITTELSSKDTGAKVRSWMDTHPEMLNAVPGAKLKVSEYANKLEAAEKSNASIDADIKNFTTRQANIISTAKSKAAGIRTGGEARQNFLANQAKGVTTAAEAESNALVAKAATEAKALTTKAEAEAGAVSVKSAEAADKIWNRASASPQFNARKLIETGDATQWSLVAPIIQRSPTGKRDVYDALRQTLADRLSSGDIKGSTQRFNEVISPALIQTGMISKGEAQDLAKQLAQIEARRIPNPEELGKWNRMLLQAIAGYSSSLGSRGGNAGFSRVSDIPTDQPNIPSVPVNTLAPAPKTLPNNLVKFNSLPGGAAIYAPQQRVSR